MTAVEAARDAGVPADAIHLERFALLTPTRLRKGPSMRRIALWLLSTVSALVLLFSYHTSTSAARPRASSRSGTDTGAASGDEPVDRLGLVATPSGSTDASGSSGSSSSAATTYTGDAVQTRFGNVQVQITVEDGKITDSEVAPGARGNDHKDQEINAYAVPILNQEAVAAQSADIDMVSGATFTSHGYIELAAVRHRPGEPVSTAGSR